MWDLGPGEQLTPDDIEKAMEDPEVRPVPIHGAEKGLKLSAQLYFGPGFEERLELEMEEYVVVSGIFQIIYHVIYKIEKYFPHLLLL